MENSSDIENGNGTTLNKPQIRNAVVLLSPVPTGGGFFAQGKVAEGGPAALWCRCLQYSTPETEVSPLYKTSKNKLGTTPQNTNDTMRKPRVRTTFFLNKVVCPHKLHHHEFVQLFPGRTGLGPLLH